MSSEQPRGVGEAGGSTTPDTESAQGSASPASFPLPSAQHVRELGHALDALAPRLNAVADLFDHAQRLEDQIVAQTNDLERLQEARKLDVQDAQAGHERALSERNKAIAHLETRIQDLERQRNTIEKQNGEFQTKVAKERNAWEYRKREESAEYETVLAARKTERLQIEQQVQTLREQLRSLHEGLGTVVQRG